MKLNKIFLGFLAMLSVVLTACSSDDYEWATAEGNQVYFSNELPSTVEISTKTNTFDVTVSRVKTDEAITVPLAVELADGSIFTAPTSVSFASGEKEAKATFSYDPSKIKFGQYEDIKMSIGGEGYTTEYGYSDYTFKAGATQWGSWLKYNQAGTCSYTYSVYWNGEADGLSFEIRHNSIETNEYQIRVPNAVSKKMLYYDYDKSTGRVTCQAQGTGYVNSNYNEEVMVADYNTYLESIGKVAGKDFQPIYGSFDEETGEIKIPVAYYISLGSFGQGWEYITLDGYDRKDVSCAIEYTGKFTDPKNNTFIMANATLGADVTSANVALVKGDLTQETFNAIKAGTYDNMQQISESGEVKFAADNLEDGKYTLVVMSFYNGEAQSYDDASFKYESGKDNGQQNSWEALYNGVFTYGAKSFRSDGGKVYEGKDEAVLYKSTTEANTYKIAPAWTGDNDGLVFTMDAEGKIVVDGVDTGMASQKYGEVSVYDFVTFGVGDNQSAYDGKSTFNFYLVYHVEAGNLGYQLDSFTITGKASAAKQNLLKSVKKNSVGNKVNKVALIPSLKKQVKPLFSIKK